MAICSRYTTNHEDAVEILNDGFLKIFKDINRYTPAYTDVVSSFKGWLRKIMIYTAIDHFRKIRKHRVVTGLDSKVYQYPLVHEDAVEKLTYKEMIEAIQQLSPVYKNVFNLFVFGGLSHEEVAEKLYISVGTSKSDLSKARKQLQKILFKQNNLSIRIGEEPNHK
jgi:RNA polymerase sigma-70 factor (ECF subfamily)